MTDTPEDVPEEVIAEAKAAFARRIPGEVAVLVWDSLVDEDASPDDHRLRFEHTELQLEVRVVAGGYRAGLEGRVEPPASVQVEVLSEEGEVLRGVEAPDGTFAFDQVPSGTIRLILRRPAAPDIRTDWFRV
jgi:hypothetical protein